MWVVSDAHAGSLQSGSKPCDCSQQNQKYAYINIIKDKGVTVALKFGVTNKTTSARKKQQDRNCIYDVIEYCIYKFDNKRDCLLAEKQCLQQLDCGIISKEEMPDGWTETTWAYNLENITAIYEENKGTLMKMFDDGVVYEI